MISEISGHTAGDAGTSRFTKLGILVTIVIVLTGSAAQLINYGFFNQRIPGLDPGSDGGVFGVASDIALAAAAVSGWVLAARVRSARSVATALAGLLTFLAVDKVLRMHDYIPHWIAFYLPVLAAAFICLVAVARGHRGEGRAVVDRLIGVGLLWLVFSFLLHVFGRRLLLDLGVSDTTGLAYQTKTNETWDRGRGLASDRPRAAQAWRAWHAPSQCGLDTMIIPIVIRGGLDRCGSDLPCARHP